jgi:hypothetical protein
MKLFDPGYADAPFRSLCENFPDATVYPAADFRVEWGPIFHRGRLDGTARVLVIGQDPSHNENVVRRILVGEAGRRTQGFLAKLGITRSYVMINTFLYSVYGQAGGQHHQHDAAIAAYRNQWLDALVVNTAVEAVVALGTLADAAWHTWKQTPKGQANHAAYAKITHPTQPESSSHGNATQLAAAIKAMLQNWNAALQQTLKPAVTHPDQATPLVPYGDTFTAAEKPDIPSFDMPAGLPDWMRTEDGWANRVGATAAAKRANITITVPAAALP